MYEDSEARKRLDFVSLKWLTKLGNILSWDLASPAPGLDLQKHVAHIRNHFGPNQPFCNHTIIAVFRQALCALACICYVCAVNTGASSLDNAPLLDQLLEQLGIGKGSSKKVAQLAKAALKTPTTSLKAVASINPGKNVERGLQAWAHKQAWRKLLPMPYKFDLLLQVADYGTTCKITDHYALLPHEVFHSLHKYGRQLFPALFGDEASFRKWWSLAEEVGGDWYTNHPVITEEPRPEYRIPYGLHGDDAGVQGGDQVLCITWGPLAGGRKTTLDTRIAFAMVKVSQMFAPITNHMLFQVLRWSLDALASGEFPHEDHEGKLFSKTYEPDRFKLAGSKLASGLRGCWAEFRGDWKFLKETFHFENHYNKQLQICHLCNVVKYGPNPGLRASNG